jgi:hypothetical protein
MVKGVLKILGAAASPHMDELPLQCGVLLKSSEATLFSLHIHALSTDHLEDGFVCSRREYIIAHVGGSGIYRHKGLAVALLAILGTSKILMLVFPGKQLEVHALFFVDGEQG